MSDLRLVHLENSTFMICMWSEISMMQISRRTTIFTIEVNNNGKYKIGW